MIVDALILAGGRSARLGGTAKAQLNLDGESLLHRTARVVKDSGVRNVVIVGDGAVGGALTVREEPAFGGPVAGIQAGLGVLPADSEALLILACDMPGIAAALPALLAAAPAGGIAVDRDRRQPLAIVVPAGQLKTALDALPTTTDASMRALLAHLDLATVAVPEGATDDVDTWDDAARFGIDPLTSGSLP